MSELEVMATRSFTCVLGDFTRGRRYRLDTSNPIVKGLIQGRSLRVTGGNPVETVQIDFDAADTAALDEFLESRISHGESEPEPDADSAPLAGTGDSPGVPDGRTGAKRRKSIGSQG